MTRLNIVLTALLLSTPAAAQDWTPVVAQVTPSILRMESVDREGGGICSVVVINREAGFVATAAHCVPIDVEARSMAIGKRDVEVVRINRVLDLAVLRVAKLSKLKGVVNVALREADPTVGMPVAVIGYAMGAKNLKTQFGHVAEVESDIANENLLLDAQVFPGDSGGAIVDAQGRLVSITSAVIGRMLFPNAYAIGSNAETLRLFLEGYLPAAPAVTK